MVFIPQAQPHAQSLFLFPIVFGINLIHFFDFFDEKEERCSRKLDGLLCCFDPLSVTPFDNAKMRTVSKSATFLATESVNSALFKRGETEVQIFWQGKAQNSSPILRCTFLARKRATLIANFSATMVTSLPSFSLSLSLCISLSLSPKVPHAQYRKRFRASYNSCSAVLPDCTHFSPFFSRQVESQAGGGNQAGSGPQTPGCPLQLESETQHVWTLCGRRNLNRKSVISAINIKQKLPIAGTAQSVGGK